MRYRKPFTLDQRRHAVETYVSLQTHARTLRKQFAPVNSSSRRVLRAYQSCVRAFGEELLKLDVGVDKLNDLLTEMKFHMAEYFQLNNFGE